MDYRKWANQQIERIAEPKRKTELKAILADRLGMALSTLHTRLGGRGPDFDTDQVEIIAEACGVESPARNKRGITSNVVALHQEARKSDVASISYPVLGTVEAGAFREIDILSQVESQSVVAPRSASHPDATPMAWLAHGDSMDAAHIFDGMIVIGIDFNDAGGILANNMIVVVEQNRGGLIERSVKAVAVFPDRTEFQPRSTNPVHRPIIYKNGSHDEGVEVRVLTVIHGAYVDLSR